MRRSSSISAASVRTSSATSEAGATLAHPVHGSSSGVAAASRWLKACVPSHFAAEQGTRRVSSPAGDAQRGHSQSNSRVDGHITRPKKPVLSVIIVTNIGNISTVDNTSQAAAGGERQETAWFGIL